jgi:calcineurin-like phosphoesterase family protein
MRWFTSDLHIGHTNIIPFCNRPFERDHVEHFAMGDALVQVPDVDAMNQALLNNYNSVVSPTDEVWFVGDIVMGTFSETIEFMRKFHGDKYQIPGNHCRNHKMYPKWRKWQAFYEDVGFTVLDSEVMTTVGDTEVKVCHFPYAGDSHGKDRYSGNRPTDEGHWLIHGHTHAPDKGDWEHRQIHVGVDGWDLAPVPESEIEKIINQNGTP